MQYGWDDIQSFLPEEIEKAAKEVAATACEPRSMKVLSRGGTVSVDRYFFLAGRRARASVILMFDEPKKPGVSGDERQEEA